MVEFGPFVDVQRPRRVVDSGPLVVMMVAHPRAHGSRCRRCGRVSTRWIAAVGVIWRICPSAGRPVSAQARSSSRYRD